MVCLLFIPGTIAAICIYDIYDIWYMIYDIYDMHIWSMEFPLNQSYMILKHADRNDFKKITLARPTFQPFQPLTWKAWPWLETKREKSKPGTNSWLESPRTEFQQEWSLWPPSFISRNKHYQTYSWKTLKGRYQYSFILEYVRHKKYEKSNESGRFGVNIWFFRSQRVRKKQID